MTFTQGDMNATEPVRKEALQKISEHISDASICMITNSILDWSLQPESLNNQWLDKDGSIWIRCFQQDSEDWSHLSGKMEIFFSNRAKGRFLSLVGIARSSSWLEVETREDFPFTRSRNTTVETPIAFVKFSPIEAFFWDDLLNDMVPLPLFDKSRDRSSRMVA